MRRNLDERRIRGDCPASEFQMDYSLKRLTAAVNELSRLTETRLSRAIERALADLGNSVEYTSTGIEAAHKLRLWRADYLRLAAELDAATRSFHLIERELGRRIESALADWERRFEATDPATADPETTEHRSPVAGRSGWLRGLLRQGQAQMPPAMAEHPPPEPGELIASVPLAYEPGSPLPQTDHADIAAHILGPLELTVAGTRVPRWTSLKARAIFQYLLIHQDRPVRREVLMELEWPEHSHNSARNNLNVALYSLRNTLDSKGLDAQAILHQEGCYLLNPALTCWIDRNEFLSMIHDAQRARQSGGIRQAIDASRSAVQLYRGALFEDDLAGEWYLPERRHLKELYLQSLEFLAATYCDLDQFLVAIEFGQQAIIADPCYEAAHRLLMRCYARQHQQQLVGRQYQLCTAALHAELGVSPATETIQLFRTLTSAS
jgi:DNA-binding SARP family transcriptional activator